jgi:hypothetical protein
MAILVAAATLLVGIPFEKGHLWIPASVLTAGIVHVVNRPWVVSGKRGSSASASEGLRALFNLIGFYATVGQIACIVLMAIWFL